MSRVLHKSLDKGLLITTDGETVVKRGSNPGGREVNERDVLATTDHPNMIKTFSYEIDFAAKSYTVTMEHAETTLGELAHSAPWCTLRGWLIQIAQALAALHEVGIMHGDVKQENVFICGGIAKLADFEFATRVSSPANKRGYLDRQTYSHRAPEYTSSGVFSAAADLWAFGVILYECVFPGRHFLPFHNDVRRRIRPILRQCLPVRIDRFGARHMSTAHFREVKALLEGTLTHESSRWTARRVLEFLGEPEVPCVLYRTPCADPPRSLEHRAAVIFFESVSTSPMPAATRQLAARWISEFGIEHAIGAVLYAAVLTMGVLMDDLDDLPQFQAPLEKFAAIILNEKRAHGARCLFPPCPEAALPAPVHQW